jgi:hypothetical protein
MKRALLCVVLVTPSLQAEPSASCSSWELVAVCGDRVVALGTTHFSAEGAENVAASSNQLSDSELVFSCGEGGERAKWTTRCAGPAAPASSPLRAAQLLAAEHLRGLLTQLVERPDLKKDARKRADRLLAALAAGSDDSEAFGKHLSDALKLATDRRAIDADYDARLRRDAEAKANAERAKEKELLAKKKAAAATALREIEKQEKQKQAKLKGAASAAEHKTRARATLVSASKDADRALLSAIKFSSQTNLTPAARTRTERARSRLEQYKRALAKVFQDLQNPDADAKALEQRAKELEKKVAEERKNVERLIKDGASVKR